MGLRGTPPISGICCFLEGAWLQVKRVVVNPKVDWKSVDMFSDPASVSMDIDFGGHERFVFVGRGMVRQANAVLPRVPDEKQTHLAARGHGGCVSCVCFGMDAAVYPPGLCTDP